MDKFEYSSAVTGLGMSEVGRRLMRDPVATRRAIDIILRWDFERVIVSHGIVLQSSGQRMLRAAWAWLGPDAPESIDS